MAFVNDNFYGDTLGPYWTLFNPLADCSASIVADHAEISLPSGTTHEDSGGVFTAPCLYQTLPTPTSFDVETAVATTPVDTCCGLVFCDDFTSPSQLVQWETYRDGSGQHLICYTWNGVSESVLYDEIISADATEKSLRVVREGDAWDCYYDGGLLVSFSFSTALPHAGFGAENSGTNPAFQAKFPYIQMPVPDPSELFSAQN